MKNKILPILCIFILISCLFINNSFAYQDTYNDTTFYLPDEIIDIAKGLEEYGDVILKNSDVIIFQDGYITDDYYICFFPKDSKVYDSQRFSGEHNRELIVECSSMTFFGYGTDFIYKSENTTSGNVQLTHRVVNEQEYLYTTADIYTDSTLTDFFLIPPALPTTLAEVLEAAKPIQKFQTMMHGMIPYLIAFLVGLVAFWKAWSILSKELRKA